jgi:hypothetical protein
MPSSAAGAFGQRAPALIMPLAALFPITSARPSLCALASLALRGTSGGASMTIPGGAGTLCEALSHLSRARHTGFSHQGRRFLPSWLRPFALPQP